MTRFVTWMARTVAIIGGLVLTLLIILTTLSIIGRSASKFLHADFAQGSFGRLANWLLETGIGEINGSYELLEAGVAFAIFSFFPVCQLYAGHATVDVFTSGLRPRALRVLRAFWEVVLAATIVFITWRLFEGMQRYLGNGETTLFLQFPVWWSYAASFSAALIASITAVFCGAARVIEAATGRLILPVDVIGE